MSEILASRDVLAAGERVLYVAPPAFPAPRDTAEREFAYFLFFYAVRGLA